VCNIFRRFSKISARMFSTAHGFLGANCVTMGLSFQYYVVCLPIDLIKTTEILSLEQHSNINIRLLLWMTLLPKKFQAIENFSEIGICVYSSHFKIHSRFIREIKLKLFYMQKKPKGILKCVQHSSLCSSIFWNELQWLLYDMTAQMRLYNDK